MRKIILTLTAIAALGAVAGPASQTASAKAPCQQWDLTWLQLKQGNGFIVGLPKQADSRFDGWATLSNYGPGFVRPFGNGYIQGWTYGPRFTATIYWDNGPSGSYEGRIDANGHVRGSAYDRAHPDIRASFDSMRNARCLR